MSVLYETYGEAKKYTSPDLNAKHIKRFDEEVWSPAEMRPDMRCLEIGCGTGHFLSYLAHKGVRDFIGIDQDPNLASVVPVSVQDRFIVSDANAYLDNLADDAKYDCVFMFDVLEHFTVDAGHDLLLAIKSNLSPNGAIVLKMPNAGSPWGQQFQFGDLTHLTGYTPESTRQMAVSVGLNCTACYPHFLGSPRRRMTDRWLQAILNKIVASPPEIWEGNFFAILRHSDFQ